MKLEMPDNAREAFQFLALGIGSLLMLRIGYLVAEHWTAPAADDVLGRLLVPFRRGYLISDPRTLVPAHSDLVGRICVAVLLGVLVGAVIGLIAFIIQRASGMRTRAPWLASRMGFILCTLAGAWSAIALPPRSIRLEEEGVLMTVRPELLGLALPYPAERFLLPFEGSIIAGASGAHGDAAVIRIERSGELVVIEPAGSEAGMDSLYSWLAAASAGAH